VNSVGALFWMLAQDAGNCKGVGSPDCYKVVSSAGAVATADHYGSGSFEVGGEHTCMHPPPKPYLVLRDTLCSCEAFGMRPVRKERKC
jgi:hypothetical protein